MVLKWDLNYFLVIVIWPARVHANWIVSCNWNVQTHPRQIICSRASIFFVLRSALQLILSLSPKPFHFILNLENIKITNGNTHHFFLFSNGAIFLAVQIAQLTRNIVHTYESGINQGVTSLASNDLARDIYVWEMLE